MNSEKTFLLIMIEVLLTAYGWYKFFILSQRGDTEAALIYLIGFSIIALALVLFSRKSEKSRVKKVFL